ncbi:pelargonidin 3-O-(6-caffeoylglucoside) 5-O-(6-O-malonylglucoside) 4'''-malonyltransferase [Salvia hispanica]|uniref:pelargonidin 3-O-(6-caffeoylglucoside) 5-O-(6-O-malonylglucoside) 4'''-malonyltransferase n=1 Tax=Salvia hispanica TaxID=49212 RepID=UPI0020095346|nr:pelargonidin 3-O-(6-caffeoylglucoside) 5-O-(6-O-malonylglucoside) 4'''-malonyltransferase [Salvia hispanica]XP_047964279.1 pelargonidin 3-O-(6-caffeoylglucoside) 5-O-(6-O-malonylglucoside) 4'''-malonyltransferase [Salvia hispanica]
MKINKTSTKLIKPLTPTPQNLKNYHISFLDQHVVKKYIAVVLCYQSAPDNGRLEESLAETLVHFYPLAGRYIKTDLMVDCNDQGAEFIEAEAQDDVEVTDMIGKTDTIHLCPEQYFGLDEGADDPLLSIQVTRFSCGGATIAVSVSHRVFDVSSLETFLSAWSSVSKTDGGVVPVIPSFVLATLLPNKDEKFGLDSNKCQGKEQKIAVKRLLFEQKALTRLKSERMSGVRVACAVITKALIRVDRATQGKRRDFVVFQPINMRGRTSASSPKNACGNMSFGSFTRRVSSSEEELGIGELMDLIRDGVRKGIAEYKEILDPHRDGRDVIIHVRNKNIKEVFKPETFVVSFTDWSKFGFYEVDFGWGKPIWSGVGPQRPRGNQTIMMRSKEGDGIEAWVHLNEDDMDLFEQDEEIKLFIS